jgi:hypothetical protein
MGCEKRLWLGVFGALLVLVPTAGAVERTKKIQDAIDRGVAYLKSIQTENGWEYVGAQTSHANVGTSALVGLALLECDIPADDLAVKKAAEIVRKYAPELTHTYSLSICIWFLDRLGEEVDVPLIESMAIRLIAGQKEGGGWRYECPPVGQEEVKRLTNLMNQQNVLKARPDAPKQPKGQEGQKKRRQLSPEAQQQLKKMAQPAAFPPRPQPAAAAGPGAVNQVFVVGDRMGDNSNTQFAALALWVARRYGLPVEAALTKMERRFRDTQWPDGGWDYIPMTGEKAPPNWTFYPSMTCAGLIGLAVGHGLAAEALRKHIDAEKDGHLAKAFENLARALQGLSGVSAFGNQGEMRYYFLWSLERVAEVYGLETIGKRNWYNWGSTVLINSQLKDGSWVGEYSPWVRKVDGSTHRAAPDTCFALLFLCRANVAKDLSVSLRGRKDLGVALKAIGKLSDLEKNKGVKVAASENKADKGSQDTPKPQESNGSSTRPAAESDETQQAWKMSDDLINAPAAEQGKLLENYKQSKGGVYTLALAGAIPKLPAETKAKAREALAERLTRMTAATLRAELKDDDPEIRRAASLACGMKDDKAHIPDLIPLLEDRDPMVGLAAYVALKNLTDQDFGPDKDASPADRAKAVADWKAWWQKQNEK